MIQRDAGARERGGLVVHRDLVGEGRETDGVERGEQAIQRRAVDSDLGLRTAQAERDAVVELRGEVQAHFMFGMDVDRTVDQGRAIEGLTRDGRAADGGLVDRIAAVEVAEADLAVDVHRRAHPHIGIVHVDVVGHHVERQADAAGAERELGRCLGLDESPLDARAELALGVAFGHALHGGGEDRVCLRVDLSAELRIRAETAVLADAASLAGVGEQRFIGVGRHVAEGAEAREGPGRIPGGGVGVGGAGGQAAGAGKCGGKEGVQLHRRLRVVCSSHPPCRMEYRGARGDARRGGLDRDIPCFGA